MPIVEEELDEDFKDDGDKVVHDPVIEDLLTKYSASRGELETDLADITKLKDHLGTLFPEDINFRNKFILEEKLKSCTSFYSAILSYRQEINKSISQEIDIRRKLTVKTDNSMNGIDVRKLAEEVETINKNKE